MDPAKKNVNQLQKKKTREPPAASNENGFSTDSKTKSTNCKKKRESLRQRVVKMASPLN
jgi:hypothetical protein